MGGRDAPRSSWPGPSLGVSCLHPTGVSCSGFLSQQVQPGVGAANLSCCVEDTLHVPGLCVRWGGRPELGRALG